MYLLIGFGRTRVHETMTDIMGILPLKKSISLENPESNINGSYIFELLEAPRRFINPSSSGGLTLVLSSVSVNGSQFCS